MDTIALLRCLSEASGVSGYEHQVRDLLVGEFRQYADQVQVDTLGNVIALKRGTGPEPRRAVMLATHMDEIGLIVSDIEEGFLHFEQVGGYDDRVLLGQEVIVHGRKDLPGIVGARPPHLLPVAERDTVVTYDKLLIDLGLLPEEVRALVRVGDLISMNQKLVELQDGRAAGKALDNRVSVVAALGCMEKLATVRHLWDVYAVATAQEEVGLKGAVTSSYGIRPDIGVVIDVTFGRQPGTQDEFTCELGEGPTIGCGPPFHLKLQRALVQTAKSLEMRHHLDPATYPEGTDAGAIQISGEGIPVALVSIPLRNMHTPVETVSFQDIERVARLLAAFIGSLDEGTLPGLTWDLDLHAQKP